MIIRSAQPADLEFVGAVAGCVFSRFGDYGRIVPEWLSHDGVSTFVAEEEGERAGFSMLGFYRIDALPDRAPTSPPGAYAADLLAIAVAPEHQARGVGRKLLEHAVATARAARRKLPVRELCLSVAEINERARRMFSAAGFVDVPGEHGLYDGGQKALHMRKVL